MKILHTSDWHLGNQICGHKRYEEHEQFLSWLFSLINREGVDVLIVAGDIFDTTTPPNRSLEQYYQFLARAAGSSCRHIVITAGNHDSPSLIAAPRELCKYLNITVVGHAPEEPGELVMVVKDRDGKPGLIICPVPYLRDWDVRTMQAGESAAEKTANLVAGIKARYHAIGSYAERIREEIEELIPIIATGHLFAAGGITREDDGSRDLYLGTLACVGADAFPSCIDYLALGHLHLPQRVCGNDRMRYSGAPLPMGFGEAGQTKSVLMIDVHDYRNISVKEIPVPIFQNITRLSGTFEEIIQELARMKMEYTPVLVEVVLEDSRIIPDAAEKIRAIIQGSPVEVLKVKSRQLSAQAMQPASNEESLAGLSPEEVFNRRLDAAEIEGNDRREYLESFLEIYKELLEEDNNSE
ncbi:MAG: exonuclease subunit SbcD [Methanomicrobiales archaeon]|nr:exonuclease subunit SbcD [Methanomicrobiales archaeon]